MTAVGGFDSSLPKEILSSLNQKSTMGEAAVKVGSNIKTLEDKIAKLAGNPNANQGELMKLQSQYQNAMRVLNAISEMMRSVHEMMMKIINNFRLG